MSNFQELQMLHSYVAVYKRVLTELAKWIFNKKKYQGWFNFVSIRINKDDAISSHFDHLIRKRGYTNMVRSRKC